MPIFACVGPTPFTFVVALAVWLGATLFAVYLLSVLVVSLIDLAQRVAEERRRRRGTPPLQF